MDQKKTIHVLIPLVLILFAGLLASYQWSTEPHIQVIKQSSFQPVSQPKAGITGFSIVDASSCNSADILFQVSSLTNAHIYQAGTDPSIAPYASCPFPGTGISHQCDASCSQDVWDPECNGIVRISSPTGGHAEKKGQNNYNKLLCYEGIFCAYLDAPKECSTLNPDYVCVATLSSSTNAHVADCSSNYPIKVCCTLGTGGPPPPPPGDDTDNDGVLDDGDESGVVNDNACHTGEITDCDDNCMTTPNGPTLGSCTDDAANTCTADGECSLVCEKTQKDADGDGAGDVCDDYPSDSCSIDEIDDNCPDFTNCGVDDLSAAWSVTSANEGDNTGLTVSGGDDCNNLLFQFKVLNTEDPLIGTIDPQPATMSNGVASSSWTAEYHKEVSKNTYVVQATAFVNGSALSTVSNNVLTVNANAGASCGNGVVEGSNDEECDDGNTESLDGCSEDCELEGEFSDDGCSNECPIETLSVCESSSKIRVCGNFDADECLELSDPKACASGTVCSSAYGDAMCLPPVCEDAFDCSISECRDGFRTRSCTNTGSSACNAHNPVNQIPCLKIEEPRAIPVFTIGNIIFIIILLGIYYTVKRKK